MIVGYIVALILLILLGRKLESIENMVADIHAKLDASNINRRGPDDY